MSDLISRTELFNRLATIAAPAEANELKAKIYQVIQGMETEERASGEWIATTENYYSDYRCSICGGSALLNKLEQMVLTKYCPHCGAHMKMEERTWILKY